MAGGERIPTEGEIAAMASELRAKFDDAHRVSTLTGAWRSVALAALHHGAALPAEPDWKPEKYAWLTYKGERLFVRRASDGRWEVLNDGGSKLSDDEVTDIEPVAVLTAEDVRELMRGVEDRVTSKDSIRAGHIASDAVLDEFAERGLSI